MTATSKDFRVKNGLVVEQDILLGGTLKDLNGVTIELGSTSSDTYTVKDALILQQSENPIGTVVSKSIIPATTELVSYSGNGGSSSTNQIYSVLNYNYGYFYSSSADIYSPIAGNDKLKQLFAVGNVVRITRDGYWWDLSITSMNFNSTYINVQYSITGTNSPWSSPDQWQSYWDWSANISFSTNLPVPQKYSLNLSAPVSALTSDDKLIFNGELNDPPYFLSANTIGTFDIGITSGGTSYTATFGSNTYNANTENIRKILQRGNTVTISDNTWGQTGVYLVTQYGNDTTWSSPYGFSVTFQYISGANYPVSYTNMATIFSNFFSSASATITPNYTLEYIDQFETASGNSYISFDSYDFLDIGDVLEYIPATTAVQFKDDAGNNIKAITYNNSTSEMSYDGIVSAVLIDQTKNQLYSLDSKVGSLAHLNIVTLGAQSEASGQNSVAIGFGARSQESGAAIGYNAYAASLYGTAIGYNAYASTFGLGLGYYANSYGSGISIGSNTSTNNGIALLGTATGSRAIALGVFAQSGHPSQISISSSNTPNYTNQISMVFWADGNLTRNGATYLYAYNGQNSSNQSTTSTSSNYSVDMANRFNANRRMMMIGTATILIKPTGDQNNDDTKVIEMKMVIRSTADNTFVLEPISTTTVFAGTGTLHPNWTPTFELFNNRYLHFKLDKGTDTTALGVLCKLEFQVLHTA